MEQLDIRARPSDELDAGEFAALFEQLAKPCDHAPFEAGLAGFVARIAVGNPCRGARKAS